MKLPEVNSKVLAEFYYRDQKETYFKIVYYVLINSTLGFYDGYNKIENELKGWHPLPIRMMHTNNQ
jgi:hypothetical protein